ncbi:MULTISPECIES: FAD-binding oxidoreductase [unclassified Kitasatospora]|uniref:NAD(P)/FAD-dependent oxidoreductase n=1 Tax=unclassified Kitasatospora TaxID=2633591 RepID=UPI002F9118E7
MSATYDVLVVGAGVVGLSTALELGLRGARVHVVDAGHEGGAGSRAAAGVAIPSLRLFADSVMHDFVDVARKVLDADVEAFAPDAPAIRRGRGVIRPVRDDEEREQLLHTTRPDPSALGQWVDRDGLCELEPVFRRGPFVGAFRTEAGYVVDTALYLDSLAAAARRAGATVSFGERVLAVREGPDAVHVTTSHGAAAADRLVVAAGAWSGSLPGLPSLAVHPLRGQMVELRDPDIRIDHIISGRTYLCPWRAGALCTGATEEHAGFADHVTAAGVAFLLSRLVRDFPLLARARPVHSWAGLRSATHDGRLVLGAYPSTTRVFVGTAHGGQGILTGHHTGLLLADRLDGHDAAVPAEFAPDRDLSPPPTGT